MKKRRGQVWVESVIYILIALAMIGAVLAFARPKIQEIQDKMIIDQTVEIMRVIDEQIYSAAQGGSGNIRVIDLIIKRGEMTIDSTNDKITYALTDSNSQYTEPGQDIEMGDIIARTEKKGDTYSITLTLNYETKYNLDYSGKTFTKSPTPYKISIKNDGGSPPKITLTIIS
ncbi:MAG: hypothetical protein Q7R52_00465 [archaeon]|nr:hypothetical protein [archaeon]